jgi:putative ABC transport system substrate-binding protein
MKPRDAVLGVTLVLSMLAAPFSSHAQQPAKVYRIGWLGIRGPTPTDQTPQQCPIRGIPLWQAFMEGLREYGYLPGQNLLIECRYTAGQAERAPALAAELVSLKPDLIVACCATVNARAAKQATGTIPIVMLNIGNPVGEGLVASLAHPGGNVTGLTDTVGEETGGKQLQLLKEAAPKVSRVAVLRYSGPGGSPAFFGREVEAAARVLGLTVQLYEVRAPEELEGTFAAMTTARVEGLFVADSAFLYVHGQRIVDLAAQSRLPAVYSWRDRVQTGGLMAYGADWSALFRRAGFYVDKIFHGANPGDLPVEQPTKFELVINLKTAKTLGLTIPQSLLLQAETVIQ